MNNKKHPCELNCQGLACPQPVIMTKKALDQKPAELTVVVDNPAAKENVAKFAASSGYGVNIESTDGGFRLKLLAKQTSGGVVSADAAFTDATAPVIMLGRNTLGTGSEELGAILMKSFFVSLLELPATPGDHVNQQRRVSGGSGLSCPCGVTGAVTPGCCRDGLRNPS